LFILFFFACREKDWLKPVFFTNSVLKKNRKSYALLKAGLSFAVFFQGGILTRKKEENKI